MNRKLLYGVGVLCFLAGSVFAQAKEQGKTFLRYKPLNADGVYATVSMTIHHGPWGLNFPTLPRGGENYPRLRIPKDAYSPWQELGPDWGTITLRFFNPKPVQPVDVEIQLASGPDEKSVFKTMTVKETDNIVSLCLPPDFRDKPAGIVTLREQAKDHLRMAENLHLSQQDLPTEFSFLIGGAGGFKSLYTDPAILKDELQTLKVLGFNGLAVSSDPDYMKVAEEIGWSRYGAGNWNASPQTAAAEKAASGAAFDKIKFVVLQDEPGSFGIDEIKKQPMSAFYQYLESKGLKPPDFNAADWSEVSFVTEPDKVDEIAYNWGAKKGEAAKKAYYWTVRYREHFTTQYYKDCTARAKTLYPSNPLTFVNYTDHALILGGKMLPGSPDWFKMGLDNATTLMWTEDWMYGPITAWGNGLYQRIGFLIDILRSAASTYGQPIGMYNTMDAGDNLRLKAFIAIGHGVKAIEFFDYGPTYAATENYWSDSESEYRGVAKIIRDVGKADDLIYNGQPPKAQAAVVDSTTAEIWMAKENTMPLQQERQLIHIALNQDHYPADVLNEDLLLSRDLSQYKVIYLADPYLPAACMKKLENWVSAGGLLCMMPGAGKKDEYGNPLSVSGLQGFKETAGTVTPDVGVVLREDTVSPNPGIPLPATVPVSIIYCGPALSDVKAQVLATFSDGRPALILNPYGKGKVLSYAFMPGLNYFHRIAAANPLPGSSYVTNFPADDRALICFPCVVAGVEKPVDVSQPVVEADLLTSGKGAAFILANLTRKDIPSLDFKVALAGITSVSSIEKGKIPFQYTNGKLTFSLPLGWTDIVLLEKK